MALWGKSTSAESRPKWLGGDGSQGASGAKEDALIMHPGPMNRGVEIDTSLADDINRSVIREQVELGVAIRMACLKIFCKRN